jgi:hypothetical protein
MKKGLTTFAALFQDGSFFEKDTFEELLLVPSAFLFLKIEFASEHTTGYDNTYQYFWFKPINKEGKPTTIKLANFEVVDIGPERGTYFAYGIQIKILELSTNTIHDFTTNKIGLSVFKNEIFPLLNKLNEFGSWVNYTNHNKYLKEEEKSKTLMQKIEDLEQRLNGLTEENEKLRSQLSEKE